MLILINTLLKLYNKTAQRENKRAAGTANSCLSSLAFTAKTATSYKEIRLKSKKFVSL